MIGSKWETYFEENIWTAAKHSQDIWSPCRDSCVEFPDYERQVLIGTFGLISYRFTSLKSASQSAFECCVLGGTQCIYPSTNQPFHTMTTSFCSWEHYSCHILTPNVCISCRSRVSVTGRKYFVLIYVTKVYHGMEKKTKRKNKDININILLYIHICIVKQIITPYNLLTVLQNSLIWND